MPLQLLLGASGTGKTHLLYEKLIASAGVHPRVRHIALVPEQFTMETQRKLVQMHPSHAILNIDVLSFERLAYRVFEEKGMGEFQILDDIGKNMLLRRVAGKRKEDLTLFQKNLGRAGFVSRMKSMLCELYQYGVGEEQLRQMVAQTGGQTLLNRKLSDLLVLYQAFQAALSERTIPAEELLTILAKVLPEADFLRGAVVALDGFTGFTPIQCRILEEMFRQCRLVSLALPLPQEIPLEPVEEHELFAVSKQTVKRVRKLAEAAETPVEVFYASCGETGPVRFAQSPALAYLERRLFRYGGEAPWKGRPEGISLHLAQNPREEAALAAEEIKRLVQDQGRRYREIAVVAGDLAGYRSYLEEALRAADIPYFMDTKKGILGNPLAELIRSALEAVEKNFPYEAVFGYLRTGLTPLTRRQVDLLDNYVRATGRRGASAWRKTWDRGYRGQENLDFEELNRLREAAVGPLFRLRETMRGTVAEALAGIRALLLELQVSEKMEALAGQFEAAGELRRGEEFRKAGDCLEELFGKMEQLLGEEHLSFAEFGDVLESGLAEVRLGAIPSCLDQVQVGDLERSRLTEIRALLFLGLNDGIVPAPAAAGGILSDEERDVLEQLSVTLAPTAKKRAFMERFYLYSVLTKPSEILWLSASKLSGSGEARQPSSVAGQIRRLFPELSWEENERDIYSLETARETLAKSAGHLRKQEPEGWWLSLYRLLSRQPDQQEALERILDGCFFQRPEGKISRAASRAVYGDVLSGSVTRLERYAACAYAQFLTYGLRLTERVEYEFGGADRGNFFHKALETFFHCLREENLAPEQITEEKRRELTARCIESAAGSVGADILKTTAKNAYYLARWSRITDRTLWAICEQWKAGDFRPAAAELSFDGRQASVMSWELGEGEQMYLRGLVDRLDICQDGDRLYVKIVDYKTGNISLDLNEVYHGLQLQLAVYLDAVMEMVERQNPGKKVIPAGIYYYHVEEPLVDGSEASTPEELDAKRRKALQLKGLTNGEEESASHMEPVSGEKITAEQFGLLRSFVRRKVQELGKGILEGDIAAAPYQRKKGAACEFCGFGAVCGFDRKLPGYQTRKLSEWKAADIWAKIGEEEVDENQMDGSTAGSH